MDCCNKFVPTRKIKNSNRRAPWMNRELLRLVKKKRCEYNKAKLSGIEKDWKKYKEILNKCTHEIRMSKSQYEEKLAKNVKQNPKAFYSYVNRTKSKKDTIGPLNVNGKVIDSAKDMAKELNLYFSSVFSKIDSNRDLDSTEIQCEHCVTDIIITEDIVLDKLRILKPNKSAGPDGIHSRVLKELSSSISYPLPKLFSRSVREGRLPLDWKTANVCPIFKKGSKSSPSNYRPVSLTCIVCKVLESIIKEEIFKHLLCNDLLLSSQHGFQSGKSCLSNLLEFLDDVSRLRDEGNSVDAWAPHLKRDINTLERV